MKNILIKKDALLSIYLGASFSFLGVAIGAFGKHSLENILTAKTEPVFQTGVKYHFIHALALLILGCLQNQIKEDKQLKRTAYMFSFAIIMFSFNCYAYAITQVKTFALIVPIGGFSFMIAWAHLIYVLRKASLKEN